MTKISRLSGLPNDYYYGNTPNQVGSLFSDIFTKDNVTTAINTFSSLTQKAPTTGYTQVTVTPTTSSTPGVQTPSNNTGLIIAAVAIGAALLLTGKKGKK